ncbi:MAG: SGNH/GDSL hydrolase family protein [Dokdonella sp.]|uniref:SGNH/GDSL hydrolase family protein n=1 Tax=Dokdonella sp. TaxID=2291710 RepID=UPI0032677EA2
MLLAFALFAINAHAQRPTASDPWESEIHQFEIADRAHAPKPGGIVFIGSSSIRMWTTLSEDLPGRNALNRGFGGSRIADATRYVPRIVSPYRPRMVVLYAGDNDIEEGASAQQVLEDFKAFVAAVRKDAPRTPIVFISIKPSPSRARNFGIMRLANAMVRAYALTKHGVRTVDVFDPMLGKDGQPREELFGPDRLHMNASGYQLWTSIIAPALTSR